MKHCRVLVSLTPYLLYGLLLCISSSLLAQNAPAIFYPNQLLVKFDNSSSRSQAAAKRTSLGIVRLGEIPQQNIELWQLPAQSGRQIEGLDKWAARLKSEFPISHAQPNYAYGTATSDTAYYRQWALKNTGWNGCGIDNDIGAEAAWEIRNAAKYTKVGILDTGIEWTHADLKDNIWQNLAEDADGDSSVLFWNGSSWAFDPGDLNGIDDDGNGYIDDFIGWDFANNDNNPLDDNGHGTHVAGTIGAKSDNAIGIAGVAGWGVQMVPLKILDESGSGSTYSTLLGLQYAINAGVLVTNNSYGGGAYDAFLYDYIDTNCKDAGQLFIAAAGNRGVNNDTDPLYPASYPSDIIIAVGAHNCNLVRAAFSNYGSNDVDIFAPGDAIYSTDLNGTYSYRSGTSMAAPFVTAAAVLAWKQFPNSTPSMIKNRLLSTAKHESGLSDLCVSSGRLDLYEALSQPDFYSTGLNEWQLFSGVPEVLDMKTQNNVLWLATNLGVTKVNTLTDEAIYYNTTNSNMPTNNILSVGLAEDGTAWFGTEKNGVLKYDGTSWSNYTSSNSPLPDNDIRALFVDNDNNVWIGTYGDGIAKFNGSAWTLYNTSNGLPGDNIVCITQDTFGNIWVGMFQGMAMFNGSSWTHYNTSNSGLSYDYVSDIFIDQDQNKWVSTYMGLNKFNGTTWTHYGTGNSGILSDDVYRVRETSDGTLWIGTSEGVSVFDGSTWTSYTNANSALVNNQVFCIEVDNYDNKWICSSDYYYLASLQKLSTNNNYWSAVSLANSSLGGNRISVVHIDNTGALWFGTDNFGVSKYYQNLWTHYTPSTSGLINPDVRHIAHTSTNVLYFATIDGLSSFDGTTWTTDSTLLGIESYSLHIDILDRVWYGSSSNGLYMYDGNVWTNYLPSNSGILGDAIFAIATDNTGTVWIGTENGVCSFDGTTWTSHTTSNSGICSNAVIAIALDNAGNLWFGSYDNGICKLSGSTWTSYNAGNSGLSTGCVGAITIDGTNQVWAGSCSSGSPGLFKFDGTTWTNYNTDNSSIVMTPDTDVNSIAIDADNNKWIAAFGVSVYYETPLSFTAPKLTVCKGENLSFTSNTSTATAYEWEVAGTLVGTGMNLTHTFNDVGIFMVKLTAYKGTISQSFFQFITVRNPVTVDLGQDTSICAQSFYLEPEVAASSFAWKNLSGTLLDTVEYYRVSGSGTHSVILEATDYCGVVVSDTVSVTLSGDCVLPGDVNSDGTIDIEDYLTLLFLNGTTGPARPGATTELTYQTCSDWASSLLPGVNDKHGDCTGNGSIQVNTGLGCDDSVVLKNATRTIKKSRAVAASPYSLNIIKENSDPFQWLGDTIKHTVELAREGVVNVGDIVKEVAFQLRYNLNFSEMPFVDVDGSFVGGNGGVAGGVIRKGKYADFGIMGISGGGGGGTAGTVGSVPKNKDIDTTTSTKSIFLTLTTLNAIIADDSGADTVALTSTAHNTETIELRLPWNKLHVKVFLQGAYDSSSQVMRTDLNDWGLIPSQHPYGATDMAPFGSTDIPNDVVDWVWVELRHTYDINGDEPADVRTAFLTADGYLKDARGGDDLYMLAEADNYYLVVHHRNHLAVMTSVPLSLPGNDNTTVYYDFSTAATKAYGSSAQTAIGGGVYGMYAGDTDGDGNLEYTGTGNDRELILDTLNSPTDRTRIEYGVYSGSDTNLDGKVQYSGAGNDRALILQNIGGTDPNATLGTNVPQ